jgi:hypothetical protein
MAIKVKELKDDAMIDVKVNKNYYMMLKNSLAFIFQHIPGGDDKTESLDRIMNAKVDEMNHSEMSFYTITLMLAEIEKIAKEQELYDEKEVLEPGDEGYVEPTE